MMSSFFLVESLPLTVNRLCDWTGYCHWGDVCVCACVRWCIFESDSIATVQQATLVATAYHNNKGYVDMNAPLRLSNTFQNIVRHSVGDFVLLNEICNAA